MVTSLTERRAEFDRHLWDHAADEFQAQFDERRELTADEASFLFQVYAWIVEPDDELAISRLGQALKTGENRTALLLQVCGLTRNKILSDLRASASAKGLVIPSSYQRIASTTGWAIAGPYLLTRLRAVFGRVNDTTLRMGDVFEALNQATWPGYIRQQRAKLSGHEAEYRVAILLSSLEIPFVPQEKAENPLCRDAQIGGISFDLVVPSVSNPAIVVKSTVHTANIGQFGESKDHLEMSEARDWIDATFTGSKKPTLLAFVDGVGFRSNRAGLDGVLTKSDEFCQLGLFGKQLLLRLSAWICRSK